MALRSKSSKNERSSAADSSRPDRERRGAPQDTQRRLEPGAPFLPSYHVGRASEYFLGQGTFAQIFSATDTATRQPVAIKIEKLSCGEHVLPVESEILKNISARNAHSLPPPPPPPCEALYAHAHARTMGLS